MSATTQNSNLQKDTADDNATAGIEELMQQYQLTVFTLAMHLLNDKRIAHGVVEKVFVELNKNSFPTDEAERTSLIHTTTYDVALAELVRIRREKSAH